MTAKELFERQTKYDLLHHSKRIKDLEALPHLDHSQRRYLEQSRRCVSNPCESYNSVNLNNAAYLEELDKFETALPQETKNTPEGQR